MNNRIIQLKKYNETNFFFARPIKLFYLNIFKTSIIDIIVK